MTTWDGKALQTLGIGNVPGSSFLPGGRGDSFPPPLFMPDLKPMEARSKIQGDIRER